MKVEVFKSGLKLSGISPEQMIAVISVLECANTRCFREELEPGSDELVDGGDFCMVLTKSQKAELEKFCKEFSTQINRIAEGK